MKTPTKIEVDIYGNPVNAQPTGRRRVWSGQLHCELRKGDHAHWPFCRPHEDCSACAERLDHDNCPVRTPSYDPVGHVGSASVTLATVPLACSKCGIPWAGDRPRGCKKGDWCQRSAKATNR